MPPAVTLGESTEDIDQGSGTDTSFEFFLLESPHTSTTSQVCFPFLSADLRHVGL